MSREPLLFLVEVMFHKTIKSLHLYNYMLKSVLVAIDICQETDEVVTFSPTAPGFPTPPGGP